MKAIDLKRFTSVLLLVYAHFSFSQATLPLSRTDWDVTPAGWTDSGTGSYLTAFACTGTNMGQFNGTGDYYEIFFSGTPDQLDFALKSASMSGASMILLEESPDGAAWTTIDSYGPGGASVITACANINISLNPTTQYVRWTYTKDLGNGGIDDVSISSASCTDPTTVSNTLTFPSTGFTAMDINWTSGNGSNHLVVMSLSPISSVPTDGLSYTANTAYGSGDDIGTGEFVVYNGTGNSVSVTGLVENTTYYIAIFEFNSPGECYLTSSSLTGNETTLTVTPTELRFTANPAGCIEETQTFFVTVCATDASGNVAGSYSGNITISVNSGPGTLGGTVTVAATSGCATFNTLTLSLAGTHTLLASDGSLTDGISSSFTIAGTGTCIVVSTWQGLIINEASNGLSGSKEYYEFVVAGECGAVVDIRGWILDDNNGTFSTAASYPTGSGIAQGHFRLTTNAQWASIPVGSLILLYNSDDVNGAVPGDDINDANNDSLYVIPHTESSLFEWCASIPTATGAGDSTYSPCTYAAPSASSWSSSLGLANSGDAIQVRSPAGAYWHGVSFGGSSLTGGPDNLKISTTTSGGNVLYFNGGDYKLASNWTEGAAGVDETPGLPNNAANLAWLRTIRDPLAPTCVIYPPLSVDFFDLEVEIFEGKNVLLKWNVIMPNENGSFIVQHSSDNTSFETLGSVTFSEYKNNYEFIDLEVSSGKHFYRVIFTAEDGRVHYSPVKNIHMKSFGVYELYPNPSHDHVNIVYHNESKDLVTIRLLDVLGKEVMVLPHHSDAETGTIPLDVSQLPNGTYTVMISSKNSLDYKKLTISK